MRAVLALFVAALLFAGFAAAQNMKEVPQKEAVQQEAVQKETAQEESTLHGYIVDAMCARGMAKHPETAMKKAANHTRSCALEEDCAQSGFGVFSDGKWYKFDGSGDKQALELLKNTKTEKAIWVDASGMMSGEEFAVTTLTEQVKGGKSEKVKGKGTEGTKEK